MPTLSDDFRNKARTVIADATDAERMSPDAFAVYTSIHGVEPFGPLYNEVYILANPKRPIRQGMDPEEFREWCDQQDRMHRKRAQALWAELLPYLEKYADECRAAAREGRVRGWSRESGGPVRILPRGDELPELPEHPRTASRTAVHVEELRGGLFGVITPYSVEGFVVAARKLGGDWDKKRRYWRFTDRAWLHVKTLLEEHYDSDAGM